MAARWPLHPGYMHSFGGTASYWVLVEQPLSVSVPAMVRGQLSGEPMAGSLRWFPEHPVSTCHAVIQGPVITCLVLLSVCSVDLLLFRYNLQIC